MPLCQDMNAQTISQTIAAIAPTVRIEVITLLAYLNGPADAADACVAMLISLRLDVAALLDIHDEVASDRPLRSAVACPSGAEEPVDAHLRSEPARDQMRLLLADVAHPAEQGVAVLARHLPRDEAASVVAVHPGVDASLPVHAYE